jgi:hypothetical protein
MNNLYLGNIGNVEKINNINNDNYTNSTNNTNNKDNNNINPNNRANASKKRFCIVDYPVRGQNTGLYIGASKIVVANKIFNKLVKEFNYYDNELGTKYLLFYMMDLDSKKIDGYIGTIIVLDNPIIVEKNGNHIEITHRNVVTRYTKDMEEIFV